MNKVDDSRIPALGNFPFAFEVEVFKLADRTVEILVDDVATAVGLPIVFVARIQVQSFVLNDPGLTDNGVAVLAEVSGTLPVEHQLPTVYNFGLGDGVVFLFYYCLSSFSGCLSWGIASCSKQCGSA